MTLKEFCEMLVEEGYPPDIEVFFMHENGKYDLDPRIDCNLVNNELYIG